MPKRARIASPARATGLREQHLPMLGKPRFDGDTRHRVSKLVFY